MTELTAGLDAGEYCTQVDASTLPAGLAQTVDPDGVLDGQSATAIDPVGGPAKIFTLDYGYNLADPVNTAALGDRVWYDDNADGIQDAGEAGINGARVELFTCSADPSIDAPLAFQATDAGGFYYFGNLAPGCYQVVVDSATLPPTYTPTYDLDSGTVGADGAATNINLAAGEIRLDVDFGYVDNAYCVSDVTWYDADANGLFDGADTAIAGVTVNLRGADGAVVASVVSAADGSFTVCGLQTNEYVIEITDRGVPGGASQLDGLMGTTQAGIDGRQKALVVDSDVFGVNFGYIEQGWLGNCNWTTDPNNNTANELRTRSATA